MGKFGSANPTGDGEYVVAQGECAASIAFENGLLRKTLWNDPANADLRASRTDPYLLLPGDKIHVPKIRIREENCTTDANHKFVVNQETEKLRIVLLDSDGKPRANLRYVLSVLGEPPKAGTTASDGVIEESIMANAASGTLMVYGHASEEYYDLSLGTLDPPSTITGIQARLNHLGFFCGDVDGELGPLTASAIANYQRSHNLSPTGQMDADTLDSIVTAHGF